MSSVPGVLTTTSGVILGYYVVPTVRGLYKVCDVLIRSLIQPFSLLRQRNEESVRKNREQNFIVVTKCETGGHPCVIEEGDYADFMAYLDLSTRPYPPLAIRLEFDKTVEIAKTFFTDLSRSGRPDLFKKDGEIFLHPRIEKERDSYRHNMFALSEDETSSLVPDEEEESRLVVRRLLDESDQDLSSAKKLTDIWNFRPKASLVTVITEKFKDLYGVSPIYGREDFSKVLIEVDTKNQRLFCKIKGEIRHALKEQENDMPLITNVDVCYTASLTCYFARKIIEQQIYFEKR